MRPGPLGDTPRAGRPACSGQPDGDAENGARTPRIRSVQRPPTGMPSLTDFRGNLADWAVTGAPQIRCQKGG